MGRAGPTRGRGLHHGGDAVFEDLPRFDAILHSDTLFTDGRHSRIVPRVDAVTVPGSMIDAVVTEHGVARLAGLTGRQRAEALIALAAPAHRDPLAAA